MDLGGKSPQKELGWTVSRLIEDIVHVQNDGGGGNLDIQREAKG